MSWLKVVSYGTGGIRAIWRLLSVRSSLHGHNSIFKTFVRPVISPGTDTVAERAAGHAPGAFVAIQCIADTERGTVMRSNRMHCRTRRGACAGGIHGNRMHCRTRRGACANDRPHLPTCSSYSVGRYLLALPPTTLYTLALYNTVYIPIVHTLNSNSYVVSPYKITYQSKFNSYNLLYKKRPEIIFSLTKAHILHEVVVFPCCFLHTGIIHGRTDGRTDGRRPPKTPLPLLIYRFPAKMTSLFGGRP